MDADIKKLLAVLAKSGYSDAKPQYKTSGCKTSKYSEGRFKGSDLKHFFGWRKTRYGIQTCSMHPLDGTEHIGKKKGNTHIVYIGELINKEAGQKQTVLGTYQKESNKLVIQDLGLVMNPDANKDGRLKTKNGKVSKGYFGRNYIKSSKS